ncbi:MAG: DUF4175 family protein [Candidatus Eisenbacteria bacterium]
MQNSARFRLFAKAGHARFRRRRFLESAVLGLSVLLPGILLAIGVGIALRFRPESAWVGPALAFVALIASLVVAFRYGLSHRLTYEEYLRRVESLVGLERNELVNADELEVRLDAMDDPLSRGLAAQAVDAGIAAVRKVPFEKLAPAIKLTGPAWRTAGAVLVGAALFVLAPGAFQSGLARLLHPGSYEVLPAVRILVEPGDVVLQRGEPLEVTAVVPGDAEGASLFWRSEGGPWRSIEMRRADAGSHGQSFSATLRGLLETSEYAVSTEAARSETFGIEVTEPLRALGYRKNLTPPAYTGIPSSQELSADGNVSAVFGTELRLSVQTGRSETSGELVWEDGSAQPLKGAGEDVLYTDLRVDEERAYRVRLTAEDLEGKEWLSRSFRIVPVPDRMPTLYQLAPETSIELPEDMQVQIDADCVDDFGLTRLDLVYQRSDRKPERVRLSTWKGEREARVVYDWDLEGIALVPEDVIKYHLELTDNDVISGPKTVRGPMCEVRFPSLADMYADVQEDRGDQMGDVAELKEKQEELREELDRALTDLKRSDELGWEQQEALKELAKKQEDVENKLEDLVESLEKSLEKMEQGDLFSPEMQQKVQEINELAKQIQDPEFQKQMDELKSALEKLDKNSVEKSLESMQLSQEDLAQSLDRTLELLRRLKNEEALDQIVQQAQRLLEQQRKLNEQLAANMEKQQEAGMRPESEMKEPKSPEKGGEKADEMKSDESEQPKDDASEDGKSDDEKQKDGKSDESKSDRSKSEQQKSDQAKADEQNADEKKSDQAEQPQESQDPKSDQAKSDQAKSDEQKSDSGESPESKGAEKKDQQGGTETQPQDQAAQEQNEPSEQSGQDSMTPEEKAELQKKQEELQKELEELEEKLAELQKEAEENWKALDEQMKKNEPKKDLDSAQQNMNQSAKKMPASPNQSMKFGRQAEKDLEQFAQSMEQAQQAVAQEEQEDITRQLFHISGQLVEVSQDQEGLLGEAPSQPTRDLAASQAQITQAARQTLDDLNDLGRRSRLLSPDLTRAMNGAVRALESSTRAFERGNRQSAMAEGKSSTNTLNETVIELLETNDQMCNNPSSGSCNNPMSKMRSLSAQQEQLNADAQAQQGGKQQGGQRLQPQGGGQSGSEALEQLAARQEMIRRGLQELQEGMGDRKDILGRLDELAGEMGDVVDEMHEKGEIDDRILERQQKILSRLLTAQKSIRREDEKEDRVSRTGENPLDRDAPPPVAQELGRQELLQRGILRGSQDPIPDEFRSMVEDYYQSLSRE